MKYDLEKIEAFLAKILRRQTVLEKGIAATTSIKVMDTLSRRHFQLSAYYSLLTDLSMLIRFGTTPTGEKPVAAAGGRRLATA
jgi:hypothetical protein